jgi:hypothetical protein
MLKKTKPVYDYFQPDHGPNHVTDLGKLRPGQWVAQVHSGVPSYNVVVAGKPILMYNSLKVLPVLIPHFGSYFLQHIGLQDTGLAPIDASPLLYHQNNWLKQIEDDPMSIEEVIVHVKRDIKTWKNPDYIIFGQTCLAQLTNTPQ